MSSRLHQGRAHEQVRRGYFGRPARSSRETTRLIDDPLTCTLRLNVIFDFQWRTLIISRHRNKIKRINLVQNDQLDFLFRVVCSIPLSDVQDWLRYTSGGTPYIFDICLFTYLLLNDTFVLELRDFYKIGYSLSYTWLDRLFADGFLTKARTHLRFSSLPRRFD
jgi:hypothetical protein